MKRALLNIVFLSLTSVQGFCQVVLNEVMAYNTSTIQNPELLEYTDWIEIYNATDQPYDLAYHSLSDDIDDLGKWRFPAGTILDPGDYLIVWADDPDQQVAGLHANFKLDVSGETLYLANPESGLILDSITFSRQFENVSFGNDNNNEHVYFSNPTPGSLNDHNSGFKMAYGVTFDPPPGLYPDAQYVTLTWEGAGGTIRYTLDGSEPDENSTTYSGLILVNTNTVIRTKTWAEGYEPGWTETGTYLIGENLNLPVFSLVTDPPNLWDDYTGIYVQGLNGIPGYCNDSPMNFNQDWERPLSIEYFDLSGTRILQVDGGTKIFGGCSRGFPMKSLAFYARSSYGANEIRYPFFREKPDVDWFKNLVFRNSGNDFQYTLLRDGAMQAIAKGRMDIDAQAFEPVHVFLNGEYWGIHNLREKLNEYYPYSNYRIPPEEIDFITNRYEVFAGSASNYIQLDNYLNSHSLSIQENYEWVADRMDVDEYMNYLMAQLYFGNDDWPGNNLKYWRQHTVNGKWRWILYDLDFGMGLYGFDPAQDMLSFATATDGPNWPNPPWSTLMIRRLFENETFRNAFIQRYMMHLNTTFSEVRVIQVIDSLYGRIAGDFQKHIDQWHQPGSMGEWENNVEQLRDFARMRPEFVWQNMRNFFSLGDVISFNIGDCDTAGTVIVNGFSIPREGFSGRFFKGYPVELEALPACGNTFYRWEIKPGELHEEVLLPAHSSWKYFDAGYAPAPGWTDPGFNDDPWSEGEAELGYGDDNEVTILNYGPDPENKYNAYYFRCKFDIPDISGYSGYTFRLMRDDGAVVYVNGEEVLRVNMREGAVDYSTFAITYVGGDDEFTYFEYSLDELPLTNGTNLISVEMHQSSPTSSDISFDLELLGNYYTTGEMVYIYNSHTEFEPEEGITITPVFTANLEMPELIINEIMASNQAAYTDESGEFEDWIEIYNAGEQAINLAGFYFTDDLSNPAKYRIPDTDPAQTTIHPGDYSVLFADQDTLQGPLHLNFRLGAGGEEIGLFTEFQGTLTLVDSVIFGPQAIDISYGRYPDGATVWKEMSEYTPGAKNKYSTTAVDKIAQFSMEAYPNPASDLVYIHVHNSSTDAASNIFEVQLFDLAGRLILHNEWTTPGSEFSCILELSQVPPGFYLLKAGNGNQEHIERLIIQ